MLRYLTNRVVTAFVMVLLATLVIFLIANTAPVAWGGVGNPIRTLGGVTGLPEAQFSAMAGRILPPLSLILPFWLVRSTVGWRETFQVWPALLVSGLSFAGMQFYWSNFQDIGSKNRQHGYSATKQNCEHIQRKCSHKNLIFINIFYSFRNTRKNWIVFA